MLAALVRALAAVADVELTVALHPQIALPLPDSVQRMAPNSPIAAWLRQASREFDACLVVAPETGGVLERLVGSIAVGEKKSGGGRSAVPHLMPDIGLQRLFADKLATAERLVPWSIPTRTLDDLGYFEPFVDAPLLTFDAAAAQPAWTRFIVKPRDGAGAQHTAVCDRSAVAAWLAITAANGRREKAIVQPYLPGRPCSVAVIADGRGGAVVLPPVDQRIELTVEAPGIDAISYRGGAAPIPEELAGRAHSLADFVLDAVPELEGCIGIDLLLGTADDGLHDRIVEVNPRPTTAIVLYAHCFPSRIGEWLLHRLESASRVRGARTVQSGATRRTYLQFDDSKDWEFDVAGRVFCSN